MPAEKIKSLVLNAWRNKKKVFQREIWRRGTVQYFNPQNYTNILPMVNIGKLKFVSSILCIFSGSRAQSVVQWPLRMGKKENVLNEQDLNRASKALELCQSCIPLNWRNFSKEEQSRTHFLVIYPSLCLPTIPAVLGMDNNNLSLHLSPGGRIKNLPSGQRTPSDKIYISLNLDSLISRFHEIKVDMTRHWDIIY